MAIFYPRKQTVIILVACIVVVGSAAYFSGNVSFVSKMATNNASGSAIVTAKETITDNITTSSNDWQKEFFDASGNSATYKAPNSARSTKAAAPLSTTDRFGRDFFARFMVLKQNNLTDDTASVKTVIDQSMNDLVAAAPQPKMYFRKDILISSVTTTNAERVYANTVGSLFYTKAPREDAALMASQALELNDPKELAGVTTIVNQYSALLAALKKVPVPESLASYHVDLLNGVSSMLYVAQGMNKVFSDPVQGLVALNMYGSAQDSLRISLLQFKNRFAQNGIVFTAGEYGKFFATIL